ncbi:oligosaccharide flippase family protein [Candidatus Bathyarchaeota archaeon]|nr:oligosaccharide flippase family protein [Candidatus Bathyarchaeota archaeon]MBT4319288.1 oligosaccharide flippase family protein [Candidatus Bathyarchaeota archaeon]MBT4422900.1 oligosaccharide flippase family protein [Candidatus Bathyarchaeota archaeon]MBT6603862.1 oligosaccharide flippase family protein [Candidatus Bathyarchaeota archaeon]MBT7187020.1 oligosaccharide flippase family protein [Candidatus Bathyarchaeota archaeon]
MGENLNDLVNQTTRGSLILLLGQVSSTVVLAIGMLLVANLLGAQSFGQFNLAQSIVSMASLVIGLGIRPSMIKYISQYRFEGKNDQIRVLIETGVFLSLISSGLATFIVYSLSGFIANQVYNQPEQAVFIQYLSLGIIGTSLMTLSMGITVGYERMKLRSILNIIYSFLKSVSSPILIYLGFGVLGAIFGHFTPVLLSGTLGLGFILVLRRNEAPATNDFTHIDALKMILVFGFPIYLTNLLNGIIPQLFITILGTSVSDTVVGNYAAAIYFSVLLSFVTLPIGTTIFPLFSKLENNLTDLRFLYRNAVKYSTLFAYPIVVMIMAMADPIITALFGTKYPLAPHFLRYYMLLSVVIGTGSVCNAPLLNSQKKASYTLKSTILRFIVVTPLSFLIIPRYGVPGLLAIMFMGNFVNSIYNLTIIRRLFNFDIDWKFLVKNLAISGTIYPVIYWLTTTLHVNVWIELVLGGTISVTMYLLGLILTKALTLKDYQFLRRMSRSFGPLAPLFTKFFDILIRFA